MSNKTIYIYNIIHIIKIHNDFIFLCHVQGITHLGGHITFNSVTVNREWDGVKVETLFNDAVKLSGNQDLPDLQLMFISDDIHDSKVESGNLVVLHSVNNVMTQKIEKAVKNYAFLLSQSVVLNGSLNAVNLTVLGDITLKGKVGLIFYLY